MENNLNVGCKRIFFAYKHFLCAEKPFELASCKDCTDYVPEDDPEIRSYKMYCLDCGNIWDIPKSFVYRFVQNDKRIPCVKNRCRGEVVLTKFEIDKMEIS